MFLFQIKKRTTNTKKQKKKKKKTEKQMSAYMWQFLQTQSNVIYVVFFLNHPQSFSTKSHNPIAFFVFVYFISVFVKISTHKKKQKGWHMPFFFTKNKQTNKQRNQAYYRCNIKSFKHFT